MHIVSKRITKSVLSSPTRRTPETTELFFRSNRTIHGCGQTIPFLPEEAKYRRRSCTAVACLPLLRNELRHYRKRHGRAPESMSGWRSSPIPGIHMHLRLVHGQWPPIPIPSTRREIFHRDICEEYVKWMGDIRGLALATISECCAEARRFLIWLGKRGSQRTLCNATVADVDNYVMHRAKSHRRTTSTSIATRLRSFLRFLFTTDGITRNLSTAVVGPTLYAFEC